MEETTRLTTVDETKPSPQELCEIHKEELSLFCVEDQAPLCSVCRKYWDHASHTVIPRSLAAEREKQGTGSPLNRWENSSSKSEPIHPLIIGYWNNTAALKGTAETLDGNKMDDAKKLLIETWVDLSLEKNKEEGTPANSRLQNSVTWIVLVLFIIQIVGLVTTIFVFTKAKPNLPAAAAITMSPCCPPDWVMNQGNCYHAPEAEGGWDAGQHYCSSLGASLAVIENIEKLNIALKDKGPFNHWVGLLRESDDRWKWTDGTVFNNLFEIQGDGPCAYLTQETVSSANCSAEKKWLCSQKVKIGDGSHGRCLGT
uniref:Killer cell lectin-like receptor subfamily B member 1C isoform X1 n=1 Tax=Pogona vitticeps TaxID=103695 RepID=A0A6J0VCY0_9SAUR